MKIIYKGSVCEVIDLGGTSGYRLYCESISQAREDHILEHIGVEYLVQSRCNEQYDGALILDFNPEDVSLVKLYFGDRDE